MTQGTDKQGRAYLTFNQAEVNVSVVLDDGFTCAREGVRKLLRKHPQGLYFRCDCGVHLLDGQKDSNGGRFYVGAYPARANAVRS